MPLLGHSDDADMKNITKNNYLHHIVSHKPLYMKFVIIKFYISAHKMTLSH